MLMAAGIALPKTIFSHGWCLIEESKMSKSQGNVINPMELIDNYGVDPLRYYLMRNMVLGMDASFTMESFIKRYNSDLANDYGNLVNRVTMLIVKHFDGKIPEGGDYNETDLELVADAKTTPQVVRKLIGDMKIHDAVEHIMALIRRINVYLEIKAPWKSIKEDDSQKGSAATTLALSADVLRIGSQLLQPVMPSKTQSILDILGASSIPLSDTSVGKLKAGTALGEGKSPFPRIVSE
jgi:methionyl-tRNA synthetase